MQCCRRRQDANLCVLSELTQPTPIRRLGDDTSNCSNCPRDASSRFEYTAFDRKHQCSRSPFFAAIIIVQQCEV